MGKTILAVIAGYVVMVVLVRLCHLVFTSALLLLSLGIIIAFIGGAVASAIKPGKSATWLAILIFVLSIPAFFMASASAEPIWYQILRTILAPLAVMAGGCIRKSPAPKSTQTTDGMMQADPNAK